MSKTKKIYFLAAIVMLIGCYALNLSYSIFVQTEEKNVVDSYVPEISYVISQNEFAIEKNSTKIIKITINNTSKVPFNYGLKATTTATNYKIQTIKDNLSYGLLNTQDSKDIFLAITNNEDKCIKINFDLIYNYITVNFDKEAYLRDSNIDNTNQYEYDKPISLKEMIINNATNNESETKSFLIEENKITDNLENESYLVKNTIDLGTYYYFKGNVLDNYLSFNNMCFRVVSIDNMNNIKLIFAGDGSCDTTSNSTGYAKLEKDYISVKFSEENDLVIQNLI